MPASHTLATRYLTLSFDDGYRASSVKTAALFERSGLRADFNVVATFEDRNPVLHGDWALWNELAACGHCVHPHGYNHTNKTQVPFEEARDLILRCLDVFATHLNGFDPARALFAFPYNVATPELEAWLPSVVRGFRTGPGPAINPLPDLDTAKLTTCGWQDAELWLDRCVDDLLAREAGWLIYCAHGLDGEGWGPLRADYLERLLDTLVGTVNLEVVPATQVLERFSGVSE
jgi:peptidoglycan/xylan/chitin deacetylase (PgdA/CDA1 family)